MQGESVNELVLNFFGLVVSGRGSVALGLLAPVSLLMIAVAWRIAIGRRQPSFKKEKTPP
jgi:hypothetical protein